MDESIAAQIAGQVAAVRARIDEAAHRVGRRPEEITLVAVSKTFSDDRIRAAVAAGITDLGESRVQEGVGKIERLGPVARWHLVGHLQTNKARAAVEHFEMIQSLDSIRLAETVSHHATAAGKTIDCLLEVDSSGEESKFGLPLEVVAATAERVMLLPGLKLRGLMTIGPWTANEGCIRKAFDLTYAIFDKMKSTLGEKVNTLSMGMSSDFSLAIACGSNMVRVGTAIFGVRPAKNPKEES